MKKILFVSFCVANILAVQAQSHTHPPAAKKKAAPAAPQKPVLKNAVDSFSYALGLSIAGFYREQGVDKINNDLVLKALDDAKSNHPLMDETEVNNCIVNYMQGVKAEKASAEKKAGEAFLEENKTKPGVITLPSGLQYTILKEGTGPKPTLHDKVKVHYQGSLLDGTIFDSSIQRGQPITLDVSNVIPGWTEALQLMPVGSKWRLFIPSDLAYGDHQAGKIKPGSTLIFDVELLDIVH